MLISLGRARFFLPLGFAFLTSLHPTVCAAQILEPAAAQIIFESQVSYQSPSPNGCASSGVSCIEGFSPSGQSVSFSGDGNGLLSSSNQYGTDPSVSSSFTFSGTMDPETEYRTLSEVFYQFAVDGPANQTVAVNIAATSSGSRNATPGGGVDLTAQGILEVYDNSDNLLLTGATCVGVPSGSLCDAKDGSGTVNNHENQSDSFDVNQTLELTTDTVYNILIETEIQFISPIGTPYSPPDLSASVSVDPTITLDTTDPAYSLQFSANPTPEPNYLMLTVPCMAIGMLLDQVRRRRDLEADCR